jgi:tryptophan synthase alpha chain
MSRIASLFTALRQQNRQALIPYITAGDPQPSATVVLMHSLVAAGADIIELGVPFSDPMADGPVIQLACERALSHGTSLKMVLAMVAEFRQQNSHTPVVLMGYLNPIEAMGMQHFISEARAAGVDGVLAVDLPPEEAADIVPQFRTAGLDVIFLIAPTTTRERIESAAQYGSGYIYYVSLKGVTGSSKLNVAEVAPHLRQIREITDLPVAVGFGIKDAESAAAVARIADGVIVGSALVSTIANNAGNPETMQVKVAELISAMRQAMEQD